MTGRAWVPFYTAICNYNYYICPFLYENRILLTVKRLLPSTADISLDTINLFHPFNRTQYSVWWKLHSHQLGSQTQWWFPGSESTKVVSLADPVRWVDSDMAWLYQTLQAIPLCFESREDLQHRESKRKRCCHEGVTNNRWPYLAVSYIPTCTGVCVGFRAGT